MLNQDNINKLKMIAKEYLAEAVVEPQISSEQRKQQTSAAKQFRDQYKIQLLPDLNFYLYPGNYSIVGAPTKGGKTVLTCTVAAHTLAQGKSVLYISNEPPLEDVEEYVGDAYPDFDDAWDQGKFKFIEKTGGQDTYNIPAVLGILKGNVNNYDLIVFDQLSYLTGTEKFKEYDQFVHRVLSLVKPTKTHILLTQQLTRNASTEMAKTPPHAWSSQHWLADCSSTVKPAQNGILYRADKITGIGTLMIDAPRYRHSYSSSEELISQWKQHQDRGLVRVDKLLTTRPPGKTEW